MGQPTDAGHDSIPVQETPVSSAALDHAAGPTEVESEDANRPDGTQAVEEEVESKSCLGRFLFPAKDRCAKWTPTILTAVTALLGGYFLSNWFYTSSSAEPVVAPDCDQSTLAEPIGGKCLVDADEYVVNLMANDHS